MNRLAVSSFSMHAELGPLHIERRGSEGELQNFSVPFEQKHSFEEFVGLARDRLGLSAVELCQIQFQATSDEHIASIKDALDRAHVALTAVPIDVGDLALADDAMRRDDLDRITQWFGIAARLGARFVRVNAGIPGQPVARERWPAMIDDFRDLGARAHDHGLRLLVENHGGTSSDPDFLLGLVEDVGADRLGILLDLGNFDPLIAISRSRFVGEPLPDTGLDLEKVYEHISRLAPVASLLHAKSIDPAADGAPLPDLPRALSIVAAAGYRGPISIEWEGGNSDPWEMTGRMADTVRDAFPHLA